MKKIMFLLLTLLAVSGTSAADFKAGGINYYITDDGKSVWVDSPDEQNEPCSGEICIPGSVMYQSKTYTVTAIGYGAFQGCTSLTSVKLQGSIKHIYDAAFRGCTSLRSINIPTSVEDIGSNAFQNCSSLTSFVIPPAVTTINPYVFSGCTSLSSVSFHNKLEQILDFAFEGCSSLKALIIPESAHYLSVRAFQNCTSLRSIDIQPKTFIDEYCFAGSGLNTFNIKKSWIGRFVLADCPELKSLVIPAHVSGVGNGGVSNCPKLKKVTIEDSPESLEVTVPEYNSWGYPEETEIPLFSSCGIEEIYIGRPITGGGMTFGKSLLTAKLSNNVKYIGDWFRGCSNLADLTIPGSIDAISSGKFMYCTNLATINVHRAEPPELSINSFNSLTYRKATLHIPKGAKQAYSEAPFWKNFLNVADDLEPAGIDGVTADTDDGSFDVYDLQGQLLLRSAGADALSSLAPGIYIKAADSRTEKIIIR